MFLCVFVFFAGGYRGNSCSKGASPACFSWRARNTTRSSGMIEGFIVVVCVFFYWGVGVIYIQLVLIRRVLRGVPLIENIITYG